MSRLKLLDIRAAYTKIVLETLLVHRHKRILGFPFSQQWTLEELALALIKNGFAEAHSYNKDGTVGYLVFKNGIDLKAIESALMTPQQLKIASELAPKRK